MEGLTYSAWNKLARKLQELAARSKNEHYCNSHAHKEIAARVNVPKP